MLVDELIRDGVCEDLEEALSMFPIEMIDDFIPVRQTGSPCKPTCAHKRRGRYPGSPKKSHALLGKPTLGNGLRRHLCQKPITLKNARVFQPPLDTEGTDWNDTRSERERGLQ
jgi:hypothetical protein